MNDQVSTIVLQTYDGPLTSSSTLSHVGHWFWRSGHARYSNLIGATPFAGLFKDPEFDSKLKPFCYV